MTELKFPGWRLSIAVCIGAAGCANGGSDTVAFEPIESLTDTPFEERACAEDPSDAPDTRTLVTRDNSTRYRGAAGAGVAGGAIRGAGTFVGSAGLAVATNRGGVAYADVTTPDVETFTCEAWRKEQKKRKKSDD